MHLAVLGSAGRTGRLVVARGRGLGHVVTGLQRSSSDDPGVVVGDAIDPRALARLVDGADAAIVTLAPTAKGPADVCSRATATLVDAMRTARCPRLVCLTGAMIGHPHMAGMYRAVEALSAPLRVQLAERREQERIVRESGLSWTLVRPPRLTDGPETEWHAGEDLRVGAFAKVSRATLAAFLVEATGPAWVGRGVTVLGV